MIKYPAPPPPKDRRHSTASNEFGDSGLYYFAWWYAQGQLKTKDPVIFKHSIATGYK